jgi:hypothetical protein
VAKIVKQGGSSEARGCYDGKWLSSTADSNVTAGAKHARNCCSLSINGWIVQHTGSTTYAIYLVMLLYVLSGLLVLIGVHAARSRAADRDISTSRSVSA